MTTGKRTMPYATEVDLSMVRAEAALPLLVGERLLGVLDIYSGEKPLSIPTMCAPCRPDRLLSVAVDNARRLGDEAAVLEAASPLYRLAASPGDDAHRARDLRSDVGIAA
jgi:hypothetical protein